MPKNGISEKFSLLTRWTAQATGTWQAATMAFAIIIIWLIGGFFFGFGNELYQLLINTTTTIITFLMVFLIQGSQNRDTAALHAKLDGLITAVAEADNRLIDVEHDTDEHLALIKQAAISQKQICDQ